MQPLLLAMVILGLGIGLPFAAVTIAATNGAAPEDSGLASGLLNATLQVGGALGMRGIRPGQRRGS
jgi:predicted MFS family arabinose efflux permease